MLNGLFVVVAVSDRDFLRFVLVSLMDEPLKGSEVDEDDDDGEDGEDGDAEEEQEKEGEEASDRKAAERAFLAMPTVRTCSSTLFWIKMR